MKIKNMILVAGCLLVLATVIILISHRNMNIYNAAARELADNRFYQQLLAEELKESSHELTSAVRKFVVTGEEFYSAEFMNIVHILSGERTRSLNRLVAPGQRIPFQTLIDNAGYSDRELELMRRSNQLSDDLIETEIEAMNAVRGLFLDDRGFYTVSRDPDIERAIHLIYGQAYADAIIDIMEPLTELTDELNRRYVNEYNYINSIIVNSERFM